MQRPPPKPTIAYCGSIGTMEKSMETTIMGYTSILSIFAIMTISNICTIITIITQRNSRWASDALISDLHPAGFT